MHSLSRPLLVASAILITALAAGAFVPVDIIEDLPFKGAFLHTAGLAVCTFFLITAIPAGWPATAALLLIASGAVELLQPLAGRGAQRSDFVANATGTMVGTCVALASVAIVKVIRRRAKIS